MQNTNVSMHDQTIPGDKWEFDETVTDVFDNMLARSIPQYEVMRQACFDLACKYQQHKTWILDLGCSRGGAIEALIDKFGAYNQYYGIDISEPMLEAARLRFKGYIDAGLVEIQNLDLRERYPPHGASVTMCILTLQFTPIEYRQRIVQDIYNHTTEGGALILVEKVLGADSDINQVMIDLYYDLKSKNGYTQDQIERKRLSLEGVLVPVTAKWNEELMRMAGFKHIDCFWRWMNFSGWVAVK